MKTKAPTGKTTEITRIAVRETSVSRHHGGQLRGPQPIRALSYLSINWAPMKSREARLSDNGYIFFQSASPIITSVHQRTEFLYTFFFCEEIFDGTPNFIRFLEG